MLDVTAVNIAAESASSDSLTAEQNGLEEMSGKSVEMKEAGGEDVEEEGAEAKKSSSSSTTASAMGSVHHAVARDDKDSPTMVILCTMNGQSSSTTTNANFVLENPQEVCVVLSEVVARLNSL